MFDAEMGNLNEDKDYMKLLLFMLGITIIGIGIGILTCDSI